MKYTIATFLLLLTITACQNTRQLAPHTAQQMVEASWQQEAHILWQIEWAAMPSGGPLTVESWRAGERYRYEILEATAPALVGEILIFDGQTAWQYNHLSNEAFIIEAPTNEAPAPLPTPWLSPISDIFWSINQRLAEPPLKAEVRATELSHGPAQEISLIYAADETFILWQDEQTGLPARLRFTANGAIVQLTARELDRLADPPLELFQPVR